MPPDPDPINLLSPAVLVSLRIDNRDLMLRPLRDNEGTPGAWLSWSPSDGTYFIHSGGFTVARAPSAAFACALLRNERLEPGFCKRVLTSKEAPDEALMPPEERRALTSVRNAHEADRRSYAAQQADAERQRRAEAAARTERKSQSPADHAGLSLDDLL